ncbi:hydantoinase/oxoprolinase family protein [Ruixingdingia sedimenti]|uniref:Hydantoinase/oxoprolinase family protein n=1 Tax=Ruixingdingia sedimenti TaxID=3073604 RepID=A0ABU1F8Z6_9RHOB|nr:hydantoinase/oxoprolinase family protein [Xinfangfangia sp. LG-4]MDR5653355.1 hydantoinase/oxoprolinase family protein [Xinfangfangia sp. LG-4]
MMQNGEASYLVATDVGGTCTDTIVFGSDGAIHIGKALSTPPDFETGVLNSIASAAGPMGMTLESLLARTHLFIHGTTVVDNAVLTRDGARTGLLTTAGFEDTLHVTRGAYGRWSGLTEERIKHPVKTDRAPALTPRDAVAGIPERVDCDGDVVLPLDEAAVERAVRFLTAEKGVEAIAVSFLWSFLNPDHERRVRDIIARVAPGAYVTLSSDIAPVPGEYERTSTAVINAYAGRITRSYLTSLQSQLAGKGYGGATMVMQGYGGLLPADEAADRAVGLIECGPAAGVIGARFLGDLMGDRDVIAADMGGTTFKVGVIQNGQLEYAREPMVDRFHYVAPKIEVVSIGSGGGSIVTVDPRTGLPMVGPRSAGARPGPICYGQGGEEPTLTDVMLMIGYMDPGQFLGGSITLDREKAERIFRETVAEPLGLPVEQAAIGIYRIASAQITDLIREITVERGLDPRDFVLHSFGGTCGMLAAAFGEELSVKRVVIPYTASVNCAFGLVSADIAHEYAVTLTLPADTPAERINALFAPLEEQARAQLAAEGVTGDRVRMEWSVDLRYSRQVHEVTTAVSAPTPLDGAGVARLVDDFEALYERKYGKGSAYREAGIEMTMFRLTARGLMPRPALPEEAEGAADATPALIGRRRIFDATGGAMAEGTIYDFTRLAPGMEVTGPAVIHTPITTIALHSGHHARMDRWRNIVVQYHA